MKIYIRTVICIYLFLLILTNAYSQIDDTRLIQFSGIVVTQDSLKPIPYTSIIVKNTGRIFRSDFYGYFSFVALPKDIIIFTAIGYKKSTIIVPDTIKKNRYSLIKTMCKDTIMLPMTVIYPWPTVEQFKQTFVHTAIPDDDLERAKKNLLLLTMKDKIESYGMDAKMNYNDFINKQVDKLYYVGQYPPNNLLNPFAWSKFIQAWQDGSLKIKQ